MTERLHFPFSLWCIGEGNGNPLQCSCLENPRDGGAWWAAVYGVAQSRTRLKWLSSNSSSPFIEELLLFSRSVMCDFLWSHGLKHTRLRCPSPSPGPCSNSCPWSRWCHPTILSSVVPFSSCLKSFPASGSFLMNRLFPSGGQSIGASASASVLPMNIQDWFPLGLTCWISLQSKGLSWILSNTTDQKHQFFSAQPSLWSNSYILTWLLEKP